MKMKYAGLTLAVFGLVGTVAIGQTEERIVDKEYNVQVVLGDQELPSHWIGVSGAPVDGLLKKHLKLETGVVIQWVSDDSPASKAGLQADDIILSVDGKGVGSIEAVAKLVGDSGSQSMKFAILRDGDEKRIKVKPEKRPDGVGLVPQGNSFRPSDIKSLNQWVDNEFKIVGPNALKGTTILRLMPGGIVDTDVAKVLEGFRKSEGEVKGRGVTVHMTKNNDGKAKITVTENGKTTSVTEDEIDKLPESVREHVKRLLSQPKTDLKGVIGKAIPGARLEIVRRGTENTQVEKQGTQLKKLELRGTQTKQLQGQQQIRIRQLQAPKDGEVQAYQIKVDSQLADQLKEVQKQLEELRKEIQSLKKNN